MSDYVAQVEPQPVTEFSPALNPASPVAMENAQIVTFAPNGDPLIAPAILQGPSQLTPAQTEALYPEWERNMPWVVFSLILGFLLTEFFKGKAKP